MAEGDVDLGGVGNNTLQDLDLWDKSGSFFRKKQLTAADDGRREREKSRNSRIDGWESRILEKMPNLDWMECRESRNNNSPAHTTWDGV